MREFDGNEREFAAAVATAAFPVSSLEEMRTEYQKKMVESFKDKDHSGTSRSASRRGSFELGDSTPRRRRSSEYEAGELGREIIVRTNSIRSVERTVVMKADAWERDELIKIDERYTKMISKITEWENEKKSKAKLQMERRKAELERLRTLTSLRYQSKTEWIDSVVRRARTQLEEKRRSEECSVKGKAKKMRSTGKFWVKFLCFECHR